MSRLNELLENHEQLDKLVNVLKHYSVNAEFVTASLIEKFGNSEEDDEQGSNEELISDLKQLYATY
ncbi:hypothetical protein [Paenibacillus cremeus]|uniref:Uncharacterized protein n=1 Tax=Paenibacillus cremeus TaxID=2163881 RepID=A0A559JK73_9BACL|nr:hypothetical protein [Paenibacillus cremeus]TVY00273.1 hypothetical protein FPZ49_33345 [Paenibacillus cremeus]